MADQQTSAMIPASGEATGYTSIKGDEPFSLVSFVGDAVAEAIARVPDELLDLVEHELKRKMGKKGKPTAVDYALRVSFWREFEKCMALGRTKITTTHIYVGICHERYFYGKFLHNPEKVAWLIQPMQAYKREMEAILHRGTERLWELVEMPIKDKRGNINPRLAEILLKTIEKVENRVHGMALQRTEAKSTNLHAHVAARGGPVVESEKQLEDRMRQLEAEVGTKNGGDRVDGTVVDVEALPPADENVGGFFSSMPAFRVGVPGSIDGEDAAHADLPQQDSADPKADERT